jgi:ATP-dependent helicase HrpA
VPAERSSADLVEAIVDRAFVGEDDLPRTAKAFEEQKKRARQRLPAVAEAALRHLARSSRRASSSRMSLAQNGALGRVVGDVKAARDRMVYPGSSRARRGSGWKHVPRYLKGYGLRLQKYLRRRGARPEARRDGAGLWQMYEARAEGGPRTPAATIRALEEFRWMIEELRVSLFAQELRTPMPVSAKRLQRSGKRRCAEGGPSPLDVRKIRQFGAHTLWYAASP